MKNPGQAIRERRGALGLTTQELGERVGVTAATISRYESGDIKQIRYDRLIPLANALNIEVSELMGWPEFQPPEPEEYDRICAIMRDLLVILPDGSVDFVRLSQVAALVKVAEGIAVKKH